MTIEEKAKAYDKALGKARKYMEGGYGNLLMPELFPELKESEDEQSKKWILEYLYDGLRKSDEQFKGQFKAAIAWLEKQGEQNTTDKVEPKESEDEKIRKGLLNYFKRTGLRTFNNMDANSIIAWLEKQSEQNPAEWSEEDEEMFDSLIDYFETMKEGASAPAQEVYNRKISWLKSLRPQNHWKPSREQLLSLRQVISGCSYDIKPLLEIEEQLRKL